MAALGTARLPTSARCLQPHVAKAAWLCLGLAVGMQCSLARGAAAACKAVSMVCGGVMVRPMEGDSAIPL